MLKQTQIERVFPSVSLTKGSLSPQGNCVGQGNIKWTLLSKNKCFWRSLDILNIALHWPGQLPSDARTRSRWQHYLLELDLFLCPETTHKEPGTGNSYWVLQVFPGHWDQTGMKQQLESTPREQRESCSGICIIALILLLKISRAKSSGLHSDLKPCQGRQHFQGREKRKQRRSSRRNFYSRTSIVTPDVSPQQMLLPGPLRASYMPPLQQAASVPTSGTGNDSHLWALPYSIPHLCLTCLAHSKNSANASWLIELKD